MLKKCHLTGTIGKFVKAHIIPRALCDRNLGQSARLEYSENSRPLLRHTGWYDDKILCEEGERIIAEIDNNGVKLLQNLGLCWRFFPLSERIEQTPVEFTEFTFLRLRGFELKALHLLIVSIAWRAAVSKQSAFKEIRFDPHDLNKMRKIILGEIDVKYYSFPITFTVLTTKGPPHNLAPIRRNHLPDPDLPFLGSMRKEYRFFLDGLIVHIHRSKDILSAKQKYGPMAIGVSDELVILGRTYEGSWQEENSQILQEQLWTQWPSEADRIFRKIS